MTEVDKAAPHSRPGHGARSRHSVHSEFGQNSRIVSWTLLPMTGVILNRRQSAQSGQARVIGSNAEIMSGRRAAAAAGSRVTFTRVSGERGGVHPLPQWATPRHRGSPSGGGEQRGPAD